MGFQETNFEDENMKQENQNVICAEADQLIMWDNLQRKINILIKNLNSSNITNIVQETLSLNLIKGRGLFCTAILESLEASQTSSSVLAAFVAAINVEFPDVGYLLLKRTIFQLKTYWKRGDEVQVLNTVKLIAHLVNQGVVLGSFALDLLMFLLQGPLNEAGVGISVCFLRECGCALQELVPHRLDCIFQFLGTILEEGDISKELQDQIKGLEAEFEGCPDIPPIVNLEDQVTHEIGFYYEVDPELSLDVFSPECSTRKNKLSL